MIVRRLFALFALVALLVGAGCGRDQAVLGPETDEPLFVEGRQLNRQVRYPEALNCFLKVIEKRGARQSPESHLEAGQIYLVQTKNPVRAIYHFDTYLELQPNSAEAPRVRGLVLTAMREFATTIPGRILEDQSVRVGGTEDLNRLQRENQELRAENATLRGGGAAPISRSQGRAGQAASVNTTPFAGLDRLSNAPAQSAPPPADAPQDDRSLLQPAPMQTAAPTPVSRPPTTNPAPTASSSRPTAPTRPGAAPTATNAPASSGRAHTVSQRQSLWAIARLYYGNSPTAAQVQGIYLANRDVMKNEGDLRPGMVLRIP